MNDGDAHHDNSAARSTDVLEGAGRRADDADIAAETGRDNRANRREAREGVIVGALAHRNEESITRRGHAATDDDHIRD